MNAPDYIRAILRSREYCSSKFDPVLGCWTHKDCAVAADEPAPKTTRLRGITKPLRNRLWSRYSYKDAERVMPTASSRRVRTGVRTAKGGRRRGSAVHQQLHAVAAFGYDTACAMYRSKCIEMLPLVVKLLDDFRRRGWTLVCAELPVYDEREPLRIGSAIDLVCRQNSDGRLLLLELKVGGDNYRYKANAYMENELARLKIHNSPTNQAKIQLLVYKALFERCYGRYVPQSAVAGYSVVYLGESAPPVYVPLKAADFALQPLLISALSAGREADSDSDDDDASDAEASPPKRAKK